MSPGQFLLVLSLGDCFAFFYITLSIIYLEKVWNQNKHPDLESGRRKRHPS